MATPGGPHLGCALAMSYGFEMLQLMIDGVPHLQAAAGTRGNADAFIRGAKEQAAGLDANDLIYSLESSGDFDAEQW
jgi:homoserine O-acetyltransferase